MLKRIARFGLPVVLVSMMFFGPSESFAAGGRSGGGGSSGPHLGGPGPIGPAPSGPTLSGPTGIQSAAPKNFSTPHTLSATPNLANQHLSNSGGLNNNFKSFNSLHSINPSWQSGGSKFLASQKNWQSNQWAIKNWKGNPWNWSGGGFWWGVYPVWWPVWGWGGGYTYVYDYGEPVYETAGYTYVSEPTVEAAPTAAQVSAEDGNDESAGAEYFSQAQGAFSEGHYKDALRMANHAAVESPQNPKAHELMSLSLFALGDYRGSAIEAHAALALGPPADWPTLYAYYGDDAKYTNQLRALEKYSKDNPNAADAHFLRAYHNLMMGHLDQFKLQIDESMKLAPKDKLAGELVSKYGEGKSPSSASDPPSVLREPIKKN